ncbi:MAG: hypothetical protein PVJ86_02785 [Phycisphaerales bacterium]|jgi:hypothetical protein
MTSKKGKIQVTVESSERMRAITELSVAIRLVAEALSRPPQVTIADCTIVTGESGTGIVVDTAEEVISTEIKSIEEDA